MAYFAGGGKSRSLMIRIDSTIVIILMAGETLRGSTGIAACVTIVTVQYCMRAGQRELGQAMIKILRIPAVSGMAFGTIMAEIVGRMIGIVGSQIIVLMTGPAIRWRTRVLAVNMAIGAIARYMGSGQRKSGKVMIEVGRFPGVLIMTLSAVFRKSPVDMVGIIYRIEIVLVASDAFPG